MSELTPSLTPSENKEFHTIMNREFPDQSFDAAFEQPSPEVTQQPLVDTQPGTARQLTMVRVIDKPSDIWHGGRGGIELRPKDAAGRLEQEAYKMRKAAEEYQPDSHMRQRFDMAANVRDSVVHSLDEHAGDARAALKTLKAARKEAKRSGDYTTAHNIDREVAVIKKVKSKSEYTYKGANDAVSRLEYTGADPQFAEKGLLRLIGSSLLRGILSNPGEPTENSAYHQGMKKRASRRLARQQVVASVQARRDSLIAKK